MRITIITLLFTLAGAGAARAETEAEAETATATTAESSWLDTRLAIPWTEPSGTGVAFGYENGSWGGKWAQGIRVRIPIWAHYGGFAINVRGLAVGDLGTGRWDFGGRLDLFGYSPVYLNFVRLYGGGGVQVFRAVTGVDDPKISVGGGGHFGFEFFHNQWMSWIVEIGGNSGGQDGYGAGATIIAGVHLYPF